MKLIMRRIKKRQDLLYTIMKEKSDGNLNVEKSILRKKIIPQIH